MNLPKFFILVFFVILMPTAYGQQPIRYVALGDSYTIGTGAGPNEAWPTLVTGRLKAKGIPIELAGNLGHNGWTTRNVLDGELPLLLELKPDYVTLLIGANDIVQGVSAQVFGQNLEEILQMLFKIMPGPGRVLMVTIPDFSVTPGGEEIANGRNLRQEIKDFNRIVLHMAAKYQIPSVDLYPLTQNMGQDYSLLSSDGLHPSARGYAQWAELILPAFGQMVSTRQ